MGRLHGLIIDIEGVSVLDDFEVIEIVYDSKKYPAVLGIDWAIVMKGVVNLKKRTISFERKSLRVIVPLEPAKRLCYIELVCDYEETDDDLD